MTIKGAQVEIIDPDHDDLLLPYRVRINGTDVGLIAKDGVQIKLGARNEVTQVTLTLIPSRVTIRGKE